MLPEGTDAIFDPNEEDERAEEQQSQIDYYKEIQPSPGNEHALENFINNLPIIRG